ncbi:unnamed protein product (macronuclear) [Paramecium tetraurelia]|uniref:Mitochondrial cardiolipin hydrolase n=1 Tax=Paramecium tetraurelia TaxID=5888 RepID=A0BZ89_PARTE|nr:uncharacterized protein GSPATT00033709001 [Paramecium tetraurelia]CAK63856.1 unnamed protein product [Paramecium tetraurelia]|eukprot:XP_001431254.1 hypothetical protein (macronuclear) [Paramecium tetraurelia strain d4-2]
MHHERSKHSRADLLHLFFPNEDNFSRFCRRLKKCKSTFLGCIYQLTHQTIIDILISLATKGCRVDIIMDLNSEEFEERKQIIINKLLVMSGFKVNVSLIESKGLMHSKFCVIDGKLTMVGSANWTYQAFSNNFEHISIISDTKTAKQFTESFKNIWDQAKQAKFIDSQIVYQPNKNCIEFKSYKKNTLKLRIKKRKFKRRFRQQKQYQRFKSKNKSQEKQRLIPELKVKEIGQYENSKGFQQSDEQQKMQFTNSNKTQDFLENLKLNEEQKYDYSDFAKKVDNNTHTIKYTNNNNAHQISTPWLIQNQQLFFPNIIKGPSKQKQSQKKEQNFIIIDDEDVQIITDFSKDNL